MLKSGTGWYDGHVEDAIIEEWNKSQPDYAVRDRELEIVADINMSRCLDLLGVVEHDRITDCATAIINNSAMLLGVLVIYSTRLRKLCELDRCFIETIADILAMAIRNIKSKKDIVSIKRIRKEKENIEKQLVHAQDWDASGCLPGNCS